MREGAWDSLGDEEGRGKKRSEEKYSREGGGRRVEGGEEREVKEGREEREVVR